MTEDFTEGWIEQVLREGNTLAKQIAMGGGWAAGVDPDGFPRAIRHRLSIGAREYGDSYLTRPLAELEDEMTQEPPDIAAWSMLYGLRRGLGAHRAQLHLIRAAAFSALADMELRAAMGSPEVED